MVQEFFIVKTSIVITGFKCILRWVWAVHFKQAPVADAETSSQWLWFQHDMFEALGSAATWEHSVVSFCSITL